MNIQLQAVNFQAKNDLNDFVKEKLNRLDQYSDQIVSADVYLKLENTSEKQNKLSEIVLHIPGDSIVVKKQGQSFEECVDVSMDTLKKLIIKRKEKRHP